MSEPYRIILTPEAQNDIRTIVLYIARTLAAPQAALRLEEDFRKEILSLRHMPKCIKPVEEQPWHDVGIRRIRVKNYYVYFWIDEDAHCVKVTAVIYVGRDQEEQLKNKQQELPE